MDSTAFLKTAELYSWVIHEFLKVVENQVFQDHLVLQTSLPWKFLLICESQLQGQMRTTDLRSARESSSGSVECLSFSLCSPDEGGQSWMVLQCVLQIFFVCVESCFLLLGVFLDFVHKRHFFLTWEWLWIQFWCMVSYSIDIGGITTGSRGLDPAVITAKES